MKNGIFKKTMASLVAASLIVSSSIVSFGATGDGTLTGTSSVTNPVYNVTVPTNLNLAFNAFGEEYGGITTADFNIINKGDSNVVVKFVIKATYASGVNLAAKKDVTPDLLTATNKDLYLAVMVSSDEGVVDSLTAPTKFTGDYDPTAADSIIDFVAGEGADSALGVASASFILGGATGTYDTATPPEFTFTTLNGSLADNPGATAFKFYGLYNAYATGWAVGDVTIAATYTLSSLTSGALASAKYDSETAHRLMLPAAGFGKTSYTVTKKAAVAALDDGVLDFNFYGDTVSKIEVLKADGTVQKALAAADYTVDTTKGTITLKGGTLATASFGTGASSIPVGSDYKIAVTLTDGDADDPVLTTYTATLVVQLAAVTP